MPTATHGKVTTLSPEEAVRRVSRARDALLSEVHKVIIGQDEMIEQMLIALFARGHCLTIGVPGLAKTLTVSTLARTLHLKFSRIQFTPDLMPSDITGTDIIEEDAASGRRVFRFVRGPVFANIVLADEINRTPPKTQSALLQAMQEYEVTAGGNTYDLDMPFFVMATQNPIEQEGTYPLPEAQLDRFMLSINIGYPSRDEERQIANATTRLGIPQVQQVLRSRDILWIQQLVRQIPATDHVVDYAVDLARATRPNEPNAPEFAKNWLAWGAGPRAVQYLLLGAKARALLKGRYAVHAADIREIAHPVLRHRIFTNFNADAEGVTPDDVVDELIKTVNEPSYGEVKKPPALIIVDDERAISPTGRPRQQREPAEDSALPQPAAQNQPPIVHQQSAAQQLPVYEPPVQQTQPIADDRQTAADLLPPSIQSQEPPESMFYPPGHGPQSQ